MNKESQIKIDRIVNLSLDPNKAIPLLMEMIASREGVLWDEGSHKKPLYVRWKLSHFMMGDCILQVSFSEENVLKFSLEQVIKPLKKGTKIKEAPPPNFEETFEEFLENLETDFLYLYESFTPDLKTVDVSDADWKGKFKKKINFKYLGIYSNNILAKNFNFAIILLMAIYTLIVFILCAIADKSLMEFSNQTAVRFGASYNILVMQGEYYRLFSAAFFHFGFVHFIYNFVLFVALGYTLSFYYGPVFLMLFFISSAVLPFSAEFLFLNSKLSISGGISSIITAMLGLLVARLSSSYTMGLKSFIWFILIIALFLFVVDTLTNLNSDLANSSIGHLTGLLTGAFYGFLSHSFRKENTLRKRNLLTTALFSTMIALLMSVLFLFIGSKGDVYKANALMSRALTVQDSLIENVILYNDSSDKAREELNNTSAGILEYQIVSLKEVSEMKLDTSMIKRANHLADYLVMEKEYYLIYARLFGGDTTISQELLDGVKHKRDSLWQVYDR
jgi:membrane associated rhomboid family serine protease